MSDEIIPFGKYKGQPLEAIQSDKSYLDWLLAQSWFKEKHQDMYTIIINNFQEPADTPLHNAMQIKFLNADYVLDLLRKWDNKLKEYVIRDIQFEVGGWDVKIALSDKCGDKLAQYEEFELQIKTKEYEKNKLKKEADSNIPKDSFDAYGPGDYTKYKKCLADHNANYDPKIKALDAELNTLLFSYHHDFTFYEPTFWIEIKPTVSDDFPSVLRQIEAMSYYSQTRFESPNGYEKRYKVNAPIGGTKILLVGEYTGIGATREEFIAFMNTKNITVIFA